MTKMYIEKVKGRSSYSFIMSGKIFIIYSSVWSRYLQSVPLFLSNANTDVCWRGREKKRDTLYKTQSLHNELKLCNGMLLGESENVSA